MAKRDDKEQEKPPKGSVAETFDQFGEERRFIGREEILKHTPSVAGARRKGAAGPQDVLGYVGVVRMHESGDPASPTGFGALLAYNGRGEKQFIMLGPFDTADEAAAAYDAHVDRFQCLPPATCRWQAPEAEERRRTRPSRGARHGVLRRRVH
jgi:hypothetical protein